MFLSDFRECGFDVRREILGLSSEPRFIRFRNYISRQLPFQCIGKLAQDVRSNLPLEVAEQLTNDERDIILGVNLDEPAVTHFYLYSAQCHCVPDLLVFADSV